MKVKNIAFFGIMAAILGVGGAYAATDTDTVIASKGYVDAKTASKQDHNRRFEDKLSNYNQNDATAKKDYPSMYTLKDAVDGALTNITVEGNDGEGNAITGITASDGTITVTKSTFLTESAADAAYADRNLSNLQPDGKKNVAREGIYEPSYGYANGTVGAAIKSLATGKEELSNKLAPDFLGEYESLEAFLEAQFPGDSEAQENFLKEHYPSIGAVQHAVGDAVKMAKRTENGELSVEQNDEMKDSWAEALHDNNTLYGNNEFDKYTPTVAAVEKRIQGLATVASTGNYNDLTDKPTIPSVAGLATAVPNTDNMEKFKIVKYNEQGIVTSGENAGALATRDDVTNDQVAVGANIDYTKMNGTLKDINDPNTNANCTSSSPCVLSFYKDGNGVKYVWTNMDLGS